MEPEHFDEVSVLFLDICGYTKLSAQMSPQKARRGGLRLPGRGAAAAGQPCPQPGLKVVQNAAPFVHR